MNDAQLVIAELNEILWGSRLSSQIINIVIEYLEGILHVLNDHRGDQYRSGGILSTTVVFSDRVHNKEALQYLVDKRVLTPVKSPRGSIAYRAFNSYGDALYFRADFERAIAYYRLLTGHDPEGIELYPESDEDL